MGTWASSGHAVDMGISRNYSQMTIHLMCRLLRANLILSRFYKFAYVSETTGKPRRAMAFLSVLIAMSLSVDIGESM